jgi:hypothetical protein
MLYLQFCPCIFHFLLPTSLFYKPLPKFYKPCSEKTIYFYTEMKKFLVSILAIFYLGTSVGATVNLHYCMGELVNWDLSMQDTHTCGNCGMEKVKNKKNGCCEDKHHTLQVEKDQKAESRFQADAPPSIAVITTYPPFVMPVTTSVTEEYPVSNAPPRSIVPVRIRYCIFRI